MLFYAPLFGYFHQDEDYEGNDDESNQSHQKTSNSELLSANWNFQSRQVINARQR